MVDKYLIGDQVVFPSVTVGIDSQNTFNLVAVTVEVECDIPGEIFCFYRDSCYGHFKTFVAHFTDIGRDFVQTVHLRNIDIE